MASGALAACSSDNVLSRSNSSSVSITSVVISLSSSIIMVDWSSVSGSAVLWARGRVAGASGSKLIGMAALLPWDDPAPLNL